MPPCGHWRTIHLPLRFLQAQSGAAIGVGSFNLRVAESKHYSSPFHPSGTPDLSPMLLVSGV